MRASPRQHGHGLSPSMEGSVIPRNEESRRASSRSLCGRTYVLHHLYSFAQPADDRDCEAIPERLVSRPVSRGLSAIGHEGVSRRKSLEFFTLLWSQSPNSRSQPCWLIFTLSGSPMGDEGLGFIILPAHAASVEAMGGFASGRDQSLAFTVPAAAIRAFRNCVGNSLPLFAARRRMPRQA